MERVRYDANPPVLRNNPMIFLICVVALVLAGALSGDMPQLVLAVLVLSVPVWLFLYVMSKTRRLMITDDEVRYEQGLLAKKRTELSLKSVRSIRLDQTFVQRILGVAKVEFFSAGDVPEISVAGMPDPHRIRDLIEG
ncbi:MAG: PH domain-containing protein [Paracoccaceae bacterium]